jgi:hypothetical protein
MAIPELADGRLPPGLHRASADEIIKRFCSATPQRRALAAPLRELIGIALDANAKGLYLNGSFVTDKSGPRDIDAVIVLPRGFDVRGPFGHRLRALHREFGFDIEQVAEDDVEGRDYLLHDFFGTDRDGNARGLLEVML